MNADETAKPPANGSFLPPNPNATPASGAQPVRREGILPTSGAQPTTGNPPASGAPQGSGTMPQRSAFRPTTGVAPSGTQPTTGHQPPATGQPAAPPRPPQSAQPQSAQPQSPNPQATAPGAPPSIAPNRPAERPQFSPSSAPHTPGAGAVAAGSASGAALASAPATTAPTTSPVTGTGSAPAVKDAAPSGGALSVGDRFKALAGRATDTTKTQLEKSEKARNAEASTGPRKARVLVSRIDPWSSLKIGFLLSIAAGIMTVVAMHVLWNVLNSMGTFTMIQEWISRLFTEESELNFLQFVEYSKVMSATLLIAVVNVFLLTGLATIGALLYNMISRVVGGIYVTLTDD